MKRPLKYPTASIVGEKFGLRSEEYKRVYALEQWAARHGYKGHRKQILSSRNTQGTFGNGSSNGGAYGANQQTRPQPKPAYNSSDEEDMDLPF